MTRRRSKKGREKQLNRLIAREASRTTETTIPKPNIEDIFPDFSNQYDASFYTELLKPTTPITREDRAKSYRHIHIPTLQISNTQQVTTKAYQQLPQSRICSIETSSFTSLNHHGDTNHIKNRYEKAHERKADKRFFKCFDQETNGRITKGNKVKHVGLEIPDTNESRTVQNPEAVNNEKTNSTNNPTATNKVYSIKTVKKCAKTSNAYLKRNRLTTQTK